eukprot:8764814-Pyramimonas_sp.AAC.1
MERGIVHSAQWRDIRDMTADGHTKWSIDRHMLLQVMGGTQSFKHDLNDTLRTGLARQDLLSRLRSNRLQGDLPARQRTLKGTCVR